MIRHANRLIIAMSLLVAPARAADGGMPQLDPTWFPSQLFWLTVCFVTLYTIVSLFITPRVGGVLKTRANAIDEAIALAEKLKKEAASTRGNFEAAGIEARAKASQLIAEAQAEVTKEHTAAHQKLAEKLEAELAASDAEIKKAVSKATANLDAAAIPLAQEMAEKLLGGTVDEASVRTAIGTISKAA